jgi:hypothetical protein
MLGSVQIFPMQVFAISKKVAMFLPDFVLKLHGLFLSGQDFVLLASYNSNVSLIKSSSK